MKQGTKFNIELIEDSRFVKNMDLETSLSARISGMRTAINGEDIEVWEFGEVRELEFPPEKHETENTNQLRQTITLILSKPKTKNDIYKVINTVRSQPINFLKN